MKLGFIGLGHMGSAIAAAAAKSSFQPYFLVADHHPERAQAFLEEKLKTGTVTDAASAAGQADFLFLAVKPQGMEKALAEVKEVLRVRRESGGRCILVTMAAGLEIRTVRADAGGDYPVIRMMPNTPVEMGAGCTEYCSEGVTEAELQQFEALLAPGGLLTRVGEEKMDASCALSGCGPAYVYMLVAAMRDAGTAVGLSPEEALRMAAKTVEGAGKMALETGRDPADLKKAVCSPGGATIEGVKVLEAAGFEEAARKAVLAAFHRTLELK